MTTHLADEPADPYLWLEDIRSAEALEWAASRTAETEARYASAERDALQKRLHTILDDPDRLVVPSRHGEWMYDLWRDAANPRGLWRRTSRASFTAGAPEWQVLLDVDALGREEDTAWSFAGATHGPAGSGRALVNLSPDGGDARVVREFDLGAGSFVEHEPFALDVDKSRIAWIDRDTVLVASSLDGGWVTDSGYPASARLWRRGTPFATATTLMEAEVSDVAVFVGVDHTDGHATAALVLAHDFFHSEVFVWDAETSTESPAFTRVSAPQDANVDIHGALVVVRTTTEWEVAGAVHPGGTLLVGPLDTLTEGDGSALVVAFAPSSNRVLETWSWTRNRLLLTLLEDVQSRILVLDPADGWAQTPLPLGPSEVAGTGAAAGVGAAGAVAAADILSASVTTTDDDVDDEVWLVVRGFLTPPTLLVTDAVAPDARVVSRAREAFDTSGLAVAQHWAVSADGTRIPYFEVGPRKRSGPLAVLMNGYGGFEHALTPEYSALVGAAWLERGGAYVVPNIRGGGEFGPAWHLAALRDRRHRAYEDFAAVARDLVARGVSTPAQIGCHGRSNGGLLVGNMLTTYPDDFGAIVCGVPLLDMRRYTRLSAGASWIAEYGDPDDPADWEFIRTFSPYHLVEGDRAYPPSLIYAATSDDRVGPVQARKMAALMEADTDAEVHYLEPVEGGHAGTIDNAATAALHATIYAFLEDVLVRRHADA